MSDDTEFSGVTPRILYFSGIVVAIAAAVFGVFLNWVVALQGMDTGVFGFNPWWSASAGLLVVCLGIAMWRVGLRGVKASLHRMGRWAAVGAFLASSFAAEHVLAASWKAACSEDSPVVCYRLGALVGDDGDDGLFDGDEAFDTACRGGHIDACERVEGEP